MKKILALALALMLCLCSVAFAAEYDATNTATWTSAEADLSTDIDKLYTVNGEYDADLYPAEKLSFTSVAASTNPDTTNLTIDEVTVTSNGSHDININIPSYSKVGVYEYVITEDGETTQGVTYTTEEIAVTVLVEYDYTAKNLKATPYVSLPENETAKNYDFTNIYNVGKLSVTKTVTGNLGDTSKEFNVDVTFTAESSKTVGSDITYVDGTETKTISIADMADGTQTVTITLKHGETVTFHDIPAGVSYNVEEQDYVTGDKNGENGYDEPVYTFGDSTKKISETETDTVGIVNNKDTTVETGIALDNAPYMIVLALVVVAGVMMMKKRSYNA